MMRLSSILSEAMRNIASSRAHAFIMMLAAMLCSTLLAGYETASVIGLERDAAQRIRSYADVKTVTGGAIDGMACDRLTQAKGGPRASGALRKGPQVTPRSTPGMDLASYAVTPGMIDVINANGMNRRSDASGAWVSRDVSHDFGLMAGSQMQTDQGLIRIAGVFDWPNDGRDTRLNYALIVPAAASTDPFEECWAKQWPASADLDALLLSTVRVESKDAKGSMPGVAQLNRGFDSRYNPQEAYRTRMTRDMPYLALLLGLLLGGIAVWRRRLEYAQALHSGQTKGGQLAGILCETLVWVGLGVLCSGMVIAAYGMRMAPDDSGAVVLSALRTSAMLLVGVVIASATTGLTIRERQLFHYFKNR